MYLEALKSQQQPYCLAVHESDTKFRLGLAEAGANNQLKEAVEQPNGSSSESVGIDE